MRLITILQPRDTDQSGRCFKRWPDEPVASLPQLGELGLNLCNCKWHQRSGLQIRGLVLRCDPVLCCSVEPILEYSKSRIIGLRKKLGKLWWNEFPDNLAQHFILRNKISQNNSLRIKEVCRVILVKTLRQIEWLVAKVFIVLRHVNAILQSCRSKWSNIIWQYVQLLFGLLVAYILFGDLK